MRMGRIGVGFGFAGSAAGAANGVLTRGGDSIVTRDGSEVVHR